MAQSSKEVLRFLKENLAKLDALTLMFPDGLTQISTELKDVVSAITASQSEIQEINIGLKVLQLDSQCTCIGHTRFGNFCLTDAQGELMMTLPEGSQRWNHPRGIKMSSQHGFQAPANG
jgi:hypothetical protein